MSDLNKQKYNIKEAALNGRLRLNWGKWWLMAILTFVVFIGQVGIAARVATRGEQMRLLDQDRAQLKLEVTKLEQEVNEMSALQKIDQRAQKDLGMVSSLDRVLFLVQPAPQTLATR